MIIIIFTCVLTEIINIEPHGGGIMDSRRLAEMELLHRLSRIDDVRTYQQLERRLDIKENRRTSMSMQEALALYLESIAPAIVPKLPMEEQKVKTDSNKRQGSPDTMEVVEVYRLTNQRKQNAKERAKEKKHHKEIDLNERNEEQKNTSDKEASDIWLQNAFDRLDCSRAEGYLLYSYNRQGTHSIIGHDNQPGTYGGRITSGDFGRKA